MAKATYSRIAGIWLTDLSADVNQSIKGSWSEFHPLKTYADRPKFAQTASADRWSFTTASANFSEAMIFGGFCWKVRKLNELPYRGPCFLLVSAVRRRVRKRSCVTWRAQRVLIGQIGSRFWSKPWHAAYNITHFPSAATMDRCRAVWHYVVIFQYNKIPVAFKIYAYLNVMQVKRDIVSSSKEVIKLQMVHEKCVWIFITNTQNYANLPLK